MPRSYSLLLAIILSVSTGAAQPPVPSADSRPQDVNRRGGHVMGFSHDATTHHFRLYQNGGDIEVDANSAADQRTIEQIRMHLGHIARMFADGDFK